jgi:hypothetical protein
MPAPLIYDALPLNVATTPNATLFLHARDFASQITPNHTQKITLIVAASYIGVIALLWCVALWALLPPPA